MCGGSRSVGSDELLEQRGRTGLGVCELETDQVSVTCGGAAHMADTRLQSTVVVDGSKPNRVKAFNREGPLGKHERTPLAEVFNLYRRGSGNGPREPSDNLEPDALTTVCHVCLYWNLGN
jgi:hypothetical protein